MGVLDALDCIIKGILLEYRANVHNYLWTRWTVSSRASFSSTAPTCTTTLTTFLPKSRAPVEGVFRQVTSLIQANPPVPAATAPSLRAASGFTRGPGRHFSGKRAQPAKRSTHPYVTTAPSLATLLATAAHLVMLRAYNVTAMPVSLSSIPCRRPLAALAVRSFSKRRRKTS